MTVEKIMEAHGFSVSSSCAGFEWYKKTIKYNEEDAFIVLTNPDGSGLPESMDAPAVVDIYEAASGKELEKTQTFSTLKSFIDTFDCE